MPRWITDTEPSDQFSPYTRANAGEVLPDGSSGTITVIELSEG